MRAIFLLVATNLAIVAVLSTFIHVLGLDVSLQKQGINYVTILIFATIFGFGGAFLSLLMSKTMAKASMRVAIIDPSAPANKTEAWLVQTVNRMAEKRGIKTPEVGIFPSEAPNAFATGASKNNSLVAVSQGLLNHFPDNEIEAILGHEMAHVTNGDMVTSTLLQGVLNTFVIFAARIVASLMSRGENGRSSAASFYFISMILQLVFGMLASLIVMAHSRHREYKADIGGADLSTRQNMIAALRRLQSGVTDKQTMPDVMKAFGIVPAHGLFSTHPPLEKRIEALENQTH